MILDDFPAVRGTWTNFSHRSPWSLTPFMIYKCDNVTLGHMWYMWYMWYMIYVTYSTCDTAVCSVLFKDKYIIVFFNDCLCPLISVLAPVDLVQSAVDERFMVGRGSVLWRHPWCEAACWSAHPVLASSWGDQVVRLRIRFVFKFHWSIKFV